MATKIGKSGKTKAKSVKKDAKKTVVKLTKRTYKKHAVLTPTPAQTTIIPPSTCAGTAEDIDAQFGL